MAELLVFGGLAALIVWGVWTRFSERRERDVVLLVERRGSRHRRRRGAFRFPGRGF